MQQTTGTGLGPCAGGAAAPAGSRRRPVPLEVRKDCSVAANQSSGTSVQDELIHVVIPLRASCCAVLGISFTKTVPAYPPRAGPCGTPRSPPRRGVPPPSAAHLWSKPFGRFPGFASSGGTTPQTPQCGL